MNRRTLLGALGATLAGATAGCSLFSDTRTATLVVENDRETAVEASVRLQRIDGTRVFEESYALAAGETSSESIAVAGDEYDLSVAIGDASTGTRWDVARCGRMVVAVRSGTPPADFRPDC